jgi:hypothetical protein
MIFRFTLSHEVLGSLEIGTPDGWKDCKLILERHEEFHSLVERFEGDFIFYGDNGVENGGYHFIKEIETTYGVDAAIDIEIELSLNGYTYQPLFTGQLDLSESQEMTGNRIHVPIIRNDFWSKFISRFDTPVDIQSSSNLDGGAGITLTESTIDLPSQKIRATSSFRNDTVDNPFSIIANEYIIIDFAVVLLDEVKTKYNYPITESPTVPFELFSVDFAGEYEFDIIITTGNVSFLGDTSAYLDIVIQKNNDTPIVFTKTDEVLTDGVTNYNVTKNTYSGTLTLIKGDQIRIYGIETSGSNHSFVMYSNTPADPLGDFFDVSHLIVIADTIYDDTECDGMLIHDVAASIIDKLGLVPTLGYQRFYSSFFGSQYTNARSYSEDGCAWNFALTRGLQIRGYTILQKPIYMSFKDWWEGTNPIFNIGLGYDEDNDSPDREILRVEQKSHFFDSSVTSVDFSNVIDIRKVYDGSYLFNKIAVGYRKWQSENISGIDDPQTRHNYATVFKKLGRTLTILSDFIAASLAWETTRRTTIKKSEDYKFDNDTFIVSLNPTPLGDDHYTPELDENFTTITGLLNEETRYNIILSPKRSILRWLNVIVGGLQKYTTSPIRFVGGEGNYDMSTNYDCGVDGECISIVCDSIAEDSNISQSIQEAIDPLFIPEEFTISNVPIEWEEYELIRDNRNNPIGVSQTDEDHAAFFIKKFEYTLAAGEFTSTLWPKEPFTIQVVEDTITMNDCGEEPVGCIGDLILAEDGDNFITEDGLCIIQE